MYINVIYIYMQIFIDADDSGKCDGDVETRDMVHKCMWIILDIDSCNLRATHVFDTCKLYFAKRS